MIKLLRGSLIGLVALSILVSSAYAEEDSVGYDISLSGYYKVRYNFTDQLDLWKAKKFAGFDRRLSTRDEADIDYPLVDRANNVSYFTHKFTLLPTIVVNESLKIKLQIDAFSHATNFDEDSPVRAIEPYGVWGDGHGTVLMQNTEDEEGNAIISRAYAEAKLPFGLLRFGRMASQFGMGIFSNNGENEQRWGDSKYGDTYDRVLFATKPLGIDSDFTVALLADKIIEGRLAYEGRNDDVDEYGFVMYYDTKPIAGGVYGIWRMQNSSSTNAYIFDATLKLNLDMIHFQTEAFMISGKTKAIPALDEDFPNNPGVPPGDNLIRPNMTLDAFNWVFDASADLGTVSYLGLTGGYLSGDEGGTAGSSTGDKKITSLSIDPDYNVGLIMFEQAMAYRSMVGTMNKLITIEENRVDGIFTAAGETDEEVALLINIVKDLGPTKGAAKNAIFLMPTVVVTPMEEMNLQFSFLWAIANKDYVDYVYDKSSGNYIIIDESGEYVATDESDYYREKYAKTKKTKNYGYEFDLGFSYNYTENFNFGVQAGYFLPGDIFNKPDGSSADNAFTVQTRLTLSF
jgi:hypothetical protein